MPSEQEIREYVSLARWPSDVYGVLEKVAFFLSIGDSRRDLTNNWSMGYELVVKYLVLGRQTMECMSWDPGFYTKMALRNHAHSHRNEPGDHWEASLNDLANFIINRYHIGVRDI